MESRPDLVADDFPVMAQTDGITACHPQFLNKYALCQTGGVYGAGIAIRDTLITGQTQPPARSFGEDALLPDFIRI